MTSTPPTPTSGQRSPRWLLLTGAVAGAILFGTFLIGTFAILGSTSTSSSNWLTVLFNLNFRPNSTPASALNIVSVLDISLMLLFGYVMAVMYPALAMRSRILAAIAAILPFLGMPVFIATSTAGRSAVLLSGVMSSTLALRSGFGRPSAAVVGIVASALLLFVGDFGTAAFPPSTVLALLIALGYLLWTAWLLLLALELARRARNAAA